MYITPAEDKSSDTNRQLLRGTWTGAWSCPKVPLENFVWRFVWLVTQRRYWKWELTWNRW